MNLIVFWFHMAIFEKQSGNIGLFNIKSILSSSPSLKFFSFSFTLKSKDLSKV